MANNLLRVKIALFLACAIAICLKAQSAPAETNSNAQATAFEAASIAVPAESVCAIHPESDSDPTHAIHVRADADGVARFYALPPTRAGDAKTLVLDCTDPKGGAHTYAVDLQAAATFQARPFDASNANLEVRPPLMGDPLSYSIAQLIVMGYGLRPDPKSNPAGYAQWLQAASIPLYKVGSAPRVFKPRTAPPQKTLPQPFALPKNVGSSPCAAIGMNPFPCYWTGVQLSGSQDATHNYLANLGVFNVPFLTPGGFGTSNALMSIWVGLDNVLQPIVAQSSSSAASYSIQSQLPPQQGSSPSVSPSPGDSVLAEVWYCDANGNPNLTGGYGCTHITDQAQGLVWDCTSANNSTCSSLPIPAGFAAGKTAEYVVEDDTAQVGSTQAWPDFSTTPVQMIGTPLVVTGNGTGTNLNSTPGWINIRDDPVVTLLADWPPGPASTGNSHVDVALSDVYSGVNWTNVSGRADASITATPASANIPVGMNNAQTFYISTNNAWVGQETSNGVAPFIDCTIAGDLSGTFVPISAGGPAFSFNMPIGTPVGKTFADTITCPSIGSLTNPNPSTMVQITATSPDLTLSPLFEKLVQGSCGGFSVAWANPGQGFCGSAVYNVTSALPPGITAAFAYGGSQLSICADSQATAPLGTFVINVQSNGCTGGGLFSASATIDVVPVPACQPSTCVPNSCQGTTSNGCGGTLSCASTCTSDLVCKSGLTCCAPTQIVNAMGQCGCAQGMIWNPSAGPAGACQAVCHTGLVLCGATGTCMTPILCKQASQGQGCPKNAKPGTCS
jgi:hypothetical protein